MRFDLNQILDVSTLKFHEICVGFLKRENNSKLSQHFRSSLSQLGFRKCVSEFRFEKIPIALA